MLRVFESEFCRKAHECAFVLGIKKQIYPFEPPVAERVADVIENPLQVQGWNFASQTGKSFDDQCDCGLSVPPALSACPRLVNTKSHVCTVYQCASTADSHKPVAHRIVLERKVAYLFGGLS